MAEEPSQPVPDELRTVMDAVFHLQDLHDADQPKLQANLLALAGVEEVNFGERNVSVRYDPEKVTRAELCQAITQAGFHVSEADSAPAAPPIEPGAEGKAEAQ